LLRKLLLLASVSIALVFATLASLGPASDASYADPAIDSEEQSFIDLLNQHRASLSLGPLLIDPSLTNAADWMSNDMGVEEYFSHTDSLGRSPWTRMCDFGYCYNTWKGENIAAGYVTGASVFQGWYDSPGHRANMEGPNFTVMGLARVYVQGSPYGYYWTNDFGGYTVPGASPPPAPTATPTSTPTSSPTQAPTPSPSPTPTSTSTPTPTSSPTPAPTAPPTPTPGPTVTATSTPIPSPTSPPPSPTQGSTPDPVLELADVDCDDTLTAMDSARILAHVAGATDPGSGDCPPVGSPTIGAASGGTQYHGDLTCDGRINGLDALEALRAATGDYSGIGC